MPDFTLCSFGAAVKHCYTSSDAFSVLFPSSSSAGESAPGRSGGLGEMVRPGLQHQGGGGGHRRGRLPLPGCPGGAVRCPEAPSGPALLCILYISEEVLT